MNPNIKHCCLDRLWGPFNEQLWGKKPNCEALEAWLGQLLGRQKVAKQECIYAIFPLGGAVLTSLFNFRSSAL